MNKQELTWVDHNEHPAGVGGFGRHKILDLLKVFFSFFQTSSRIGRRGVAAFRVLTTAGGLEYR